MDVVPRERPRPEWVRSHPRAWVAAVATVCFGAFMGQLDASIIALTYHAIGQDFGVGLRGVQLVSLAYLASLGSLLLPLGRLSDRVGRKRVYLWGFGIFTVASAGCSLAPTLAALAVLRSVQGAGAAMLQANGVALVVTSAPRHRMRTALGMQATAQAVGLALGPSVGGLIVQTLGWRAVFYLNLPVGIIAIAAGSLLLPRTRLSQTGPGRIRTVLAARHAGRALVGALLAYLLLFGPMVLVPNVLQLRGDSPLHAGLLAAVLPVGFALGALTGERFIPCRWSAPRRCRCGGLLAIAGFAVLFATAANPAGWAVALVLAGLGLGAYTPANNAQLMSAVPTGATAVAGSMVSASRALGTALGTLLVVSALDATPDGRLPAALLLVLCAVAVASVPRRTDQFE